MSGSAGVNVVLSVIRLAALAEPSAKCGSQSGAELWSSGHTLTEILQSTEPWQDLTADPKKELVLCVGHGRTGTTSLEAALRHLGYRTEHYTPVTVGLASGLELTAPGVGTSATDPHRALKNVDAVLDCPIPSVWPELLVRFPNARVVLTVREPSSWVRSQQRHYSLFCDHTNHTNAARFSGPVDLKLNTESNTYYAVLLVLLTHLRMLGAMAFKDQRHVSPNRMLDFGTNCPTPRHALRRYVSHNLEVIATVPAEQLLVMDITAGDGWAVLCRFLDKPIPNVPFPRLRRD